MDWEFEDLEGLGREELASRLEEVLEAQRALYAEEPEAAPEPQPKPDPQVECTGLD